MARAPAAATAPDDTDPDAGAGADQAGDDQGGDEDMGDEGEGDQGSDETVLVTITKKSDGTYMVYAGDEEPEEGEAGEADMGAPAEGAAGPGAGAPPAGGEEAPPEGAGGAAGEGAPAPQHCDSVGSAMTAAMDIMHTDEGGEGGGEAAFQAGFGGDASKPTMPQKF